MSPFVKFRSSVAVEKSYISRPTKGQGGNLCFPISPKTKLDRGRRVLVYYKVSANSIGSQKSRKSLSQPRARPAIFVFLSAKKHKLDRGR